MNEYFPVSSPSWLPNCGTFPIAIRTADSLPFFCRNLKTHIFRLPITPYTRLALHSPCTTSSHPRPRDGYHVDISWFLVLMFLLLRFVFLTTLLRM